MKTLPMRSLSALAVSAAVAAIALAGCSSAAPGGSPTSAPEGKSDAAAFVACLKSAGVEAKLGESGGVMVRDTSDGSEQTGGEGLLYTESDQRGNWLGVSDSGYFAADPTTEKAYAGCEQKFPDFEQPAFTPPQGAIDPEAEKQQLADAVAFARCGRDSGFAWVADPKADAGAAITIPSTVTEDEFRSLVEKCWDKKSKRPLNWTADGDLSFDLTAVIDSIPGLGSGGTMFTQPMAPEEGDG